jgi:polar amino acid transport system substrate-binding protein
MRKRILAVLMALAMVAVCAACGKKEGAVDYTTAEGISGATVVAEQESAGETVIAEDAFFDKAEYTAVESQARALMEVSAGTADAAVVDYVMSIGSIGEGTDYEDLQLVEGVEFSPEEYGIAFRKGSDMAYKVNQAIAELKDEGKLQEIAEAYKLEDLVTADAEFEPVQQADSDWAYIQGKGELIIGITLFQPMNYYDDNKELVGFETEFAKAVCEKLGVKAVFQEISWAAKETELEAKNIDCIWNGMTITDERLEAMSISIPYMRNKQVLIVKAK